MTKDDLETRFDICFDACTRASEGGYGADTTDRLGLWWAIDPVISEYTKQQAIAFYGRAAQLAVALNIDRQAVYQWTAVPPLRQLQLESLTNGALKADPKISKPEAVDA